MMDETTYPYELVVVADTTSEAAATEAEIAAKQRVENFLQLWRSCFSADGPLDKGYTPNRKTSLSLRSDSPTRLTATRVTETERVTYEFDTETDGLIMNHTNLNTGETTVHPNHLANYTGLARIIFTCYELETDEQDS